MECSGKAMSHDFVKSARFHVEYHVKSATKDQLPGMVRPMFLGMPLIYKITDQFFVLTNVLFNIT